MKKLLTYTACAFILSSSFSQSISDFDWLIGQWERQNTKTGSTAFEIWSEEMDGLAGQGLTLRGADTVFVENLSILLKGDAYFYVAEVAHNKTPTFFEITSLDAGKFTCENPQHDFPKKISYTLNDNVLTVVISGDGQSIPFIFKKSN